CKVSFVRMSAKFFGTWPFQLESTIAPAAPALAANSTKLWPSKFSPRKATNNSRALSVRESVLTLSITRLPSPDVSEAPASLAILESGSGFMLGKIKTRRDGLQSRVARLGYRRTG